MEDDAYFPDDTDFGENTLVTTRKRKSKSKFEAYLDDETRNIADEIPESLSPVNGKSLLTAVVETDQRPTVKPGIINDGRPIRKNDKRAVSFIEDSQFEFNQLEKELQDNKQTKKESFMNATASVRPLSHSMFEDDRLGVKSSFGQTQVGLHAMNMNENRATTDDHNSSTYKLEHDIVAVNDLAPGATMDRRANFIKWTQQFMTNRDFCEDHTSSSEDGWGRDVENILSN